MPNRRLSIVSLACIVLACDGGTGPSGGYGRITFRHPGGSVYRIEAKAGAVAQNVSLALDALSPGADEWLSTSRDGAWLLLSTERFDPECAGWACLVVVAGDLASGSVVRANGHVIHPTGLSAIASGGNRIVYQDVGPNHIRDLWTVTRSGSTWSAPVLLTGASPYAFASQPAISADGSLVLFDCGDEPYAPPGTAICEVGNTGVGFRVVLTEGSGPPGQSAAAALHHADYAPDGSIVFEADWVGEQIWKLPLGATVPVQVAPNHTDDNSPCVLPDGRIASLWLNAPGNPAGRHELKVMTSDNDYIMVLVGTDIADGGISCGA